MVFFLSHSRSYTVCMHTVHKKTIFLLFSYFCIVNVLPYTAVDKMGCPGPSYSKLTMSLFNILLKHDY